MPLSKDERRAALKRAATDALKDAAVVAAVVLATDAAIEEARKPREFWGSKACEGCRTCGEKPHNDDCPNR